MQRADLGVGRMGRQGVERRVVRPLPAQTRHQESVDLVGAADCVERDAEALGDPADDAAPVVEQVGVPDVHDVGHRVRELGDPLHVVEPQRQPFRHRHVAARMQRRATSSGSRTGTT